MDEGSCENLPACTGHDSSSSSEAIVSNIIGQWGTWGSWSECSTDCGKGYPSWLRTCLSGAGCLGCETDFGECDVRSGCSDEVEEDMGEDMEKDMSEVMEGDQEGKRKT